MLKYLRQYQWRDMAEMLANNRAEQKTGDRSLAGRHVVITGATAGIGLETARRFARHGAALTLVARNPEKAAALCEALRTEFGIACDFLTADYEKPETVHAAARQLLQRPEPVDILINNAGMFATRRQLTRNGLEKVFCVNHLSPFVFTTTLLPRLLETPGARILMVNSQGHRFGGLRLDDLDWKRRRYTGMRAYGASKTAQLLCTWQIAEQLAASGVTCNAMHPGEVRSAIGENNGSLYRWYKHRFVDRSLKDPAISANALHWLATEPALQAVTGRYFNLTHPEKPAPHALDREVSGQIWAISHWMMRCILEDPSIDLGRTGIPAAIMSGKEVP